MWALVIIHEPPGGSGNSSHTHIDSNGHVSEEQPATNEGVLGITRGLLHDVHIRGVETQGSGGQAISYQVDPEQLDWDQGFRQAQSSSEENTT